MRRCSVLLLVLAAAVAGCDSGDDPATTSAATTRTTPPRTVPVRARPPRPASRARAIGRRFPHERADEAVGYSLRYPAGWRAASVPRPGVPLILVGPGRSSCTVSAVTRLPDWSSRRQRLGYMDRRVVTVAGKGGAEGSAGPVRAVRGANSEGAAVRVRSGPTSSVAAVFAGAGSGVTLTCVAPSERFAALDRDVFRPMITTVSVRRDPALERAQPRLARVRGISGVGLQRQGLAVAASAKIREGYGRRGAVRALLHELARAFPHELVTVEAYRDPVYPLTARWDPATGAGSIQDYNEEPPARLSEP